MEEDSWGFEQAKPSDVTLKELNEICTQLKDLRSVKKEQEELVKQTNAKLGKLQAKILEHLEEYGMKNFSGEFGTVSRSKHYSVKQPATPESKSEFFDYLRGQGIFEDMVSVNSRTLSSWVRREIEAKAEEGVKDFVPPGLDKPETIEKIVLRKA